MDAPNLAALITATEALVRQARKKGELETLTPRIVRQKLEEQFSLDGGLLDSPKYKKPLKDAIAAAVEAENDEDEDMASPSSPPKPISGQKRKKKTTSKETDPSSQPKKRGKAQPKAADGERKGKAKATTSNIKSKEEVESNSEPEDKPGVKKASKPSSPGNGRKRRKSAVKVDAEGGGQSDAERAGDDEEKPHVSKDEPSKVSIPESSSGTKKDEDKSDSELSVLIDEPPKMKSKPKKGSNQEKTSRGKAASTTLSKDEETIKRLKALVLACGVRKVWSKVFQGLDQPSRQIKKLKEILSELGMSGRMSLDQAKAIKAQRELQQELQDVQSFEKAVLKQGQSTDDEQASEKESEEEKPVPRRGNARQSIMAFLQDQSDDD